MAKKKDPLAGLSKLARAKRKLKMAITGKLPASEHSPAGRKHLKKKATEKTKDKKTNLLKEYAGQTGKPKFRGASGSDLAELQKRFGKK